MKIIVCGGRTFFDKELYFHTLDYLNSKRTISIVVHGGAKGADSLAGVWAKQNNLQCIVYEADWDAYGKGAGFDIGSRGTCAVDQGDFLAWTASEATASILWRLRSAATSAAASVGCVGGWNCSIFTCGGSSTCRTHFRCIVRGLLWSVQATGEA